MPVLAELPRSTVPESQRARALLPVSVVVVARNEARNLPRCLASVHGWCSEIVVALNNTTDESAAIAAGFGARVVTLEWRGYRDTKNAALDLARFHWALCLDADEEVSLPLRSELEYAFRSGAMARHAGARFPRKVWFIDRWITHGDWYPDLSLRLVDRRRSRWGGDAIMHEKLECDGPVLRLHGDLHHYSFPNLASQVGKINAFAELFVLQQESRGAQFSVLNTLFRSVWRFFRGYVLRRGFLDGFPGLYIAGSNAFSVFARGSRLYEADHHREPPPLSESRCPPRTIS